MPLTYDKFQQELINLIKLKYPYVDSSNQSQVQQITSQVTYLYTQLNESIETQFSEQFLDSATDYENIISILELYPYERMYTFPTTGNVTISIQIDPSIKLSQFVTIEFKNQILTDKNNQNIEFLQLSDQKVTFNTQTDVVDNTFSFPITVSQMTKQSERVSFSGTNYVNKYKFKEIPTSQILIPDTLTQTAIVYDKIYDVKICKNIYEMYESLILKKETNKLYFILKYNDRDKSFEVIQQDLFGYKQPQQYTVEFTYYTTYGKNGQVSDNSLELKNQEFSIEFVDENSNYKYIKKDLNGIIYSNIIDTYKEQPIQASYLSINIQHESLDNGKDTEPINEYIINATKINRTFGRQVTKQDFYDHMSYLKSTILSNIRYKYSIRFDNSVYSNMITIYIQFITNVSKSVKDNILEIIRHYFEQIVPIGTKVAVKEQKEVKLYLSGNIYYLPNETTKQQIVSSISKYISNLNSEYLTGDKTDIIHIKEYSQYEIQKEIYRQIPGLKSVDLYLFSDRLNILSKILKFDDSTITYFDLSFIRNIDNYINIQV